MGEREIRRFGLTIIHYYVYKKNKLLHNTGDYIQYLIITYNGKESENIYI